MKLFAIDAKCNSNFKDFLFSRKRLPKQLKSA